MGSYGATSSSSASSATVGGSSGSGRESKTIGDRVVPTSLPTTTTSSSSSSFLHKSSSTLTSALKAPTTADIVYSRRIQQHLVSASPTNNDSTTFAAQPPYPPQTTSSSSFGSVSHSLRGGEVIRDIYKWNEMQQAQQLESSSAVPAISTATNPRKRRNSDPSSQLSTSLQQQSNSFNSYGTPEYAHNEVAVLNDNQQQLQQRIFDTTIYSHNPAASTAPFIIRSRHHSSSTPDIANMRASDLRVPGMFRRTFIHAQASRQGRPPPNFLTKSFIDFLALYGFYGGDVVPEEDDDEDGDVPDDNRTLASDSSGESGGGESATNHDSSEAPNSPPISASNNQSSCPPPAEEYTPLLSSSNIINNPTTNTSSQQGTSAGKAFFLLMKAFVGTGVLFLPKAFSNGGMGFSLILLLVVGILTLHCMLLLVDTSRELGGLSFGDMGERLYGANMRKLILGSIAVAQIGFCCAYYIFVGQNLRDLTMVISDCKWIWPDWVFILIQLVVYIPLCWVRKIKHFSFTSLIADVFILLGLAYIFYMDLRLLAARGPAHDIVWFNMTSFPLFVGTAIFAFEGICLILPIAESMQKPQQFGWVLTACIATIAVIFVGIGATSYATFGPKVATIIFLNMPAGAGSGAAIVPTLQFLYGLAIMLSFPLNIYPAIRITEAVIFGTTSTGKGSMLVKWQKNFYRAVLVLFTASVAWLGSDNLDKFVSLVGCFCCIPLSFIYPALFHSRVTRSPMVKIKDISLAVFGCVALIYTTYITLEQMVSGGKDVVIDRCATTHAK